MTVEKIYDIFKIVKTKEEITTHLKKFFKEKASCYKVEDAFLYGSWARGFPREDSDIDIAVVLSDEISLQDEIFETITTISLSLTDEIGLDVNVIPIRCDFNKPMLYYNAIVLGEPVFIKDFNKYIALRNEAIYHMEDFSIFGLNWYLNIARKNLEELKNARISIR